MLPCRLGHTPSPPGGRIRRFAIAATLTAGSACGSDSTGPTVDAPNARLVFVDDPADAVSDTRLPRFASTS
jgi:hypothetical protein